MEQMGKGRGVSAGEGTGSVGYQSDPSRSMNDMLQSMLQSGKGDAEGRRGLRFTALACEAYAEGYNQGMAGIEIHSACM